MDIKHPEFEPSPADEFELLDLRKFGNCLIATQGGFDEVYHLAADMGGIGYITAIHADITRNNVLINVNMLEACRINGVGRFFFSSSACVYPQYKQKSADVTPLKEEDAWPAEPEEGYGLEKLFMEKLCQYYRRTMGSRPVLPASTTSTAPWASTRAGRRRPRGDLPEGRSSSRWR